MTRSALVQLHELDRREPITELVLHDAGAVDLAQLRGLDRLARLSIAACRVTALDALAALPALTSLELHFTDASDAQPLLGLPALRRASLLGNPWSPPSWDLHLPALRARGVCLAVSQLTEWELTCALWNRGWPAGFSRIDERRPTLVVLGPEASAVRSVRSTALHDAVTDPTMSFARLGELGRPIDAPDLASHRTLGSAADAAAWLSAARLPARLADGAARFIARFPSLTYYREDATLIDAIAGDHAVAFPPWLRALRQAFAWVEPGRQVRVRFDAFDEVSATAADLSSAWYDVGLLGIANVEQRALIDRDGLFPIASWLETGTSILALRVSDPDDLRLFEFADELLDESGLTSPALAVFGSFGSLLDHIVAVQVDDVVHVAR